MGKQSLIEQAIQQNKVRRAIVNFVANYNEFVTIHNRNPRSYNPDEKSLYIARYRYTNPKNLNDEEIKYLQDNLIVIKEVKLAVENFVKEYKDYVKRYGCEPTIITEPSLYSKMNMYTNPKYLTEGDIQYLQKNGIEINLFDKTKSIREKVKSFVAEYNVFVNQHQRNPLYNESDEYEKKLYIKHLRYTGLNNKRGLNELEKKYIEDNLIKVSIRLSIKKFVEDYITFVSTKHREPKTNIIEESVLHERILRNTNSKKLNQDEINYLQQNDISVGEYDKVVKLSVKLFVKDYKNFIKTYKHLPVPNSTNMDEVMLCLQLGKYTNPKYINQAEKEYLIANDIELCDTTVQIRRNIKKFVEDYAEYIKIFRRKPRCRGDEYERRLYFRWQYYTNKENIKDFNNNEIEYLNQNGI